MNRGTFAGMSNPGLELAASIPNRVERIIATSQTWVAPVTGEYFIFAVGAGGGGAGMNSGWYGPATGGGAGGLAIKRAYLPAGTSLAITIGAGGGGGSNGNASAGNATTVSGGGVSLFAGGGAGGTIVINTQTLIAGSAGGSASGGDWNLTGGRSGRAELISYNGRAYSGGGAVAWLGQAFRGGNAVLDSSGSAPHSAAGGGAGIGGNGGDANNVSFYNNSNVYGGGGGTIGDAPAVSAGGTNTAGVGGPGLSSVVGSTSVTTNSIFALYGAGQTAVSGVSNHGSPGAGGGASANTSQSNPMGVPSMLAGVGALSGFNAGYGGGGGAGLNAGTSGGQGVVFIVWGWQ